MPGKLLEFLFGRYIKDEDLRLRQRLALGFKDRALVILFAFVSMIIFGRLLSEIQTSFDNSDLMVIVLSILGTLVLYVAYNILGILIVSPFWIRIWNSLHLRAFVDQIKQEHIQVLVKFVRVKLLGFRRVSTPIFLFSIYWFWIPVFLLSLGIGVGFSNTDVPTFQVSTLLDVTIPIGIGLIALMVFSFNYIDRNIASNMIEIYISPFIYLVYVSIVSWTLILIFTLSNAVTLVGDSLLLLPYGLSMVSILGIVYLSIRLPMYGSPLRHYRKLGSRIASKHSIIEANREIASQKLSRYISGVQNGEDVQQFTAEHLDLEVGDQIADVDLKAIKKLSEKSNIVSVDKQIGDFVERKDDVIIQIGPGINHSDVLSDLKVAFRITSLPWPLLSINQYPVNFLDEIISGLELEAKNAINENNRTKLRFCLMIYLQLISIISRPNMDKSSSLANIVGSYMRIYEELSNVPDGEYHERWVQDVEEMARELLTDQNRALERHGCSNIEPIDHALASM